MVHFHAPIAKMKKNEQTYSLLVTALIFIFCTFWVFFYKTLEFTVDPRRLYCTHRLLKSLETVLKL